MGILLLFSGSVIEAQNYTFIPKLAGFSSENRDT